MARSTAPVLSRRDRRAQARAERPADEPRRTRRRSKPGPWRSPLILTSAGALLVGVVLVAMAGGFKLGGTSDIVPPDTSYVGLPIDGASVGSSSAPVVMTVYSDFQCPACRLFVTTELPSLLRDFVRPGLVRIESMDITILDRGGSESLDLAAGAACAAEQDRYWLYHDLVFWNQGRENRGDHDAAFIRRMAGAAGAYLAAFDACYARTDVRPPIRARTAASATSGVTVTPTLVINGQTVVGVPDYAELSAYLRSLVTPSPSPAKP